MSKINYKKAQYAIAVQLPVEMKEVLVVLSTIVCCVLCSSEFLLQEEWFVWKKQHAKMYSYRDEGSKWKVWRENYQKIQEHNKANYSFTLGLNEFADMVRRCMLQGI